MFLDALLKSIMGQRALFELQRLCDFPIEIFWKGDFSLGPYKSSVNVYYPLNFCNTLEGPDNYNFPGNCTQEVFLPQWESK